MFNHCGQKFKPTDIWYLSNNNECSNRVLYIGFCPRCQQDFTCLIETDKKTNKTYSKIKQGKKAIKEIDLCKFDKIYTAQDLIIKKGKPCGWIYGENKEIHNKNGEVIEVKQKACDYFGQKEVIKTVKIC